MSKFSQIGRLTNDPELRFTPSGQAVANFNFVTSTRVLDRQTNEWKDDNVTFYTCDAWGPLAEYIAENLKKGYGVFIDGVTRTEKFTDSQGNNRSSIKVRVNDIGESVKLNGKRLGLKLNNQQGGGGYQNQPPRESTAPNNGGNDNWNAPANDPWASGGSNGSNNAGGWGNPSQDEPPF